MQANNSSYRKTLLLSSVTGAAMVAAAIAGAGLFAPPLALVLFGIVALIGVLLLLVALASVLVERRDAARLRGEPDQFLAANNARSEDALRGPSQSAAVALPALRRWLGAQEFVVGDRVRVRPLEEIAATLDAQGCLDGLPFMPEMSAFCATVGTVYRCVDKVYDYGGKKNLRRIKDTVLITGLRCDGAAHDGCQAGCYMLWKTAWLARADLSSGAAAGPSQQQRAAAHARVAPALASTEAAQGAERRYFCQYTQIVKASSPMASWDPRQDLRPLIAGNITLAAFTIALLTRLFNAAQRLRGGSGYPVMNVSSRTSSQPVNLGLQPGEMVRVADPEKIFETLNRTGKNLGLWFDRDMLKHCALRYPVLRRVDKIIDDASGCMIRMKTPCVVLDTTDSSGEFLRFVAQSDPAFWREAWLERVEGAAPATVPGPHSAGARAARLAAH